jgi:hypothetical protein
MGATAYHPGVDEPRPRALFELPVKLIRMGETLFGETFQRETNAAGWS